MPVTVQDKLKHLRSQQAHHPFWSNKLFKACADGALTKDDFKYLFSQYYLYNKNFTRYLASLIMVSESDLFRSRITENMWEEGGGAEPEKRHAEIFRKFLRNGLSVDIDSIQFEGYSRYFFKEYLDSCSRLGPIGSSAFLSLGTEGIVARMYGILYEGMLKAGIEEKELEFFKIHMECDDEHAATIEELMCSYAELPEWYSECLAAMDHALNLRMQFFNNVYSSIQNSYFKKTFDKIKAKKSLLAEAGDVNGLVFSLQQGGLSLYENINERLNISFKVEQVPFPGEVLDPRVVRILPGKKNENHRHPHETVYVLLSGSGELYLDQHTLRLKAGDLAFIPRWAMHQTLNTGEGELVILAITDFYLISNASMGQLESKVRMKR